MSRMLLLYATREGQTEKIAGRIGAQLSQRGHEVMLLNAADSKAIRQLDLSAFDQLVFGASMHAGGLERELVSFVNTHDKRISLKPRSLFVVLLSAATEDPDVRAASLADAQRKVSEQLRISFDNVEFIAGALTYSKYAWPVKWLMRRIARQSGEDTDVSHDYEYTDWRQVERYADRLAGQPWRRS